jgi:hypothetical protein
VRSIGKFEYGEGNLRMRGLEDERIGGRESVEVWKRMRRLVPASRD